MNILYRAQQSAAPIESRSPFNDISTLEPSNITMAIPARASRVSSEYRGYADEEGNIPGLGIGQGSVLCKEIKRASGNAEEQEHCLVLPIVTEKANLTTAVYQVKYPYSQICHYESDGEYCGRIHACRNEGLGTHECNSPDRNHSQRQKMVEESFRGHTGLLVHITVFSHNDASRR